MNGPVQARNDQPIPNRIMRCAVVALMFPAALGATGCSLISHLGTDLRGASLGKTFYVGGAGPFGNIGTLDVPAGLRDGGYEGAIEVFGWQSWLGGTLRDQLDRKRNKGQARRLARMIRRHLDRYPNSRVNIIALSAGTGVATWALERLPEKYRVANVVFLGSSLSRQYDLSKALRRVDGKLYNFYSTRDRILRYAIALSGSIDGEFQGPNVAGLYGFAHSRRSDAPTRALYAAHVRNLPWRRAYARFGYHGLHTDGTNPRFIARIVTPKLTRLDDRGVADDEKPSNGEEPATSQPTSLHSRAEGG